MITNSTQVYTVNKVIQIEILLHHAMGTKSFDHGHVSASSMKLSSALESTKTCIGNRGTTVTPLCWTTVRVVVWGQWLINTL